MNYTRHVPKVLVSVNVFIWCSLRIRIHCQYDSDLLAQFHNERLGTGSGFGYFSKLYNQNKLLPNKNIKFVFPHGNHRNYCTVSLVSLHSQCDHGAHTKRLRTKRLLDKTSPYKTYP
jgi:hypothetical protein